MLNPLPPVHTVHQNTLLVHNFVKMASSIAQKIGKMFAGRQTAAATAETRSVAKDRLSVILASQRGSELLQGVDMDAFQKDVMEVVKKHIDIAVHKPVQVQINSDGDISLMEMSVELEASGTRAPASSSSS